MVSKLILLNFVLEVESRGYDTLWEGGGAIEVAYGESKLQKANNTGIWAWTLPGTGQASKPEVFDVYKDPPGQATEFVKFVKKLPHTAVVVLSTSDTVVKGNTQPPAKLYHALQDQAPQPTPF